MQFKNYINESERDLAIEISNVINDFTDDVGCDINNHKQCHESVNKVKNKGQKLMVGKFLFYKSLKFIE
jgi:predicted extracellular nuclease